MRNKRNETTDIKAVISQTPIPITLRFHNYTSPSLSYLSHIEPFVPLNVPNTRQLWTLFYSSSKIL